MATLQARHRRATGGWVEREPGRFASEADAEDWVDLRYHHLVPSPEDWKAIEAERPLPGPPRAMLITDFNSYNTDVLPDDEKSPRQSGTSLVPAALGRRFDVIIATQRCRSQRRSATGADRSRRLKSM